MMIYIVKITTTTFTTIHLISICLSDLVSVVGNQHLNFISLSHYPSLVLIEMKLKLTDDFLNNSEGTSFKNFNKIKGILLFIKDQLRIENTYHLICLSLVRKT